MAIVQISRIQVRRGLNENLPQLTAGEIGWSTDTQQLYIGNGEVGTPDYAPSTGHTQILTEHSDFFSFINTYVFKGTEAGYTSVTGVTALSPIARSLQNKLDEMISVRDFGAKGDGVTDDTAAIQRAVQQIYVSGLEANVPSLRRTLKIPAGNYLITSTILIPPGALIIGDGKNNTIITNANGTVFSTADSLYQTAGLLGSNSAQLPNNISIRDLELVTTTGGTSPVFTVDSGTDLTFRGVYFKAGATTTNLVNILSTVNPTYNLTLDDCTFDGGVNGIGGTGAATSVDIINSTFTNCSSKAINVGTYMTGVSSINNYFNGISNPLAGLSGNNYSIGDTFSSGDYAGVHTGDFRIGTGRAYTLSAGTTAITTLGNGAGVINYQITSSDSYRFGQVKYNVASGVTTFDDEYTEPATSIGANVYVGTGGNLLCTVSGAVTFKYSLSKFI